MLILLPFHGSNPSLLVCYSYCPSLGLDLQTSNTKGTFILWAFFFLGLCIIYIGFLGGIEVKTPPATLKTQAHPWVGKITCRTKWQPTLVFLPVKSHEERALAGYIVHGVTRIRESLQLTNNFHTLKKKCGQYFKNWKFYLKCRFKFYEKLRILSNIQL